MLASAEDIARGLRLADPALDQAKALRAGTRILAEAESTGYLTPRVGQSWIRNSIYRALAQTPEQMAFTKPFARATSRVWELRGRIGPDKFAAGLQPLGLHQELSNFIANTTSETDMQIA